MKKVIAFLLVVLMVFALASCGEFTYRLRSPNFVGSYFSFVKASGELGEKEASNYNGLRLAMWIKK